MKKKKKSIDLDKINFKVVDSISPNEVIYEGKSHLPEKNTVYIVKDKNGITHKEYIIEDGKILTPYFGDFENLNDATYDYLYDELEHKIFLEGYRLEIQQMENERKTKKILFNLKICVLALVIMCIFGIVIIKNMEQQINNVKNECSKIVKVDDKGE